MRPFALRTALLAAALLLAASPAALAATYNRGNDTDPETLDAQKTSTISEANILRDLYDGLITFGSKAELVPGAAESWTISEDGLVYTFKLRADGKWSNGDPVTANDFVFAWRRMEDPATAAGYANILYPVKNAEAVNKGEMAPDQLGVRAVDDLTFEVTLNAPTPYFLQLLTHQSSYPLHQKSVEALGDDFSKPGNLISNGAYMLQSFTPNDKIVLVRNPSFHDAANVAIDEVVYYPMQDRSACLRRFEAGEIQSCSDVPTEQMAYMKANLGEQLRIAPYLGTYYYAVDMRKPPFDDVRVRTALSEGIDREFLATEIWGDAMVPAYSFVPPGTDNYKDPPLLAFADTPMLDREDEAVKLLAEAGFGPDNPLKVEIRHNIGENHANTATAIADMWKQIGVEVTIASFEGASYYPYLQQGGEFQIARAGWIADYSDPQNFLFMLESDNPTFNYAHYDNPDYDALMEKAAAEGDIAARADYLYQAEELVMRDQPFIPLMYYGSLSLVSSKLHGWEDNIQNAHLSRWMSLDP